jgi:hypothetical protein
MIDEQGHRQRGEAPEPDGASDAEVEKSVDDAVNDERRSASAPRRRSRPNVKKEGLTEADLRKRYRDEAVAPAARERSSAQAAGREGRRHARRGGGRTSTSTRASSRSASPRSATQVIQIPVEPDSAARELAVRRHAQEVLARDQGGRRRSRASRQELLSEDTGTAPSGGDLGWFKRGHAGLGVRGCRVQARRRPGVRGSCTTQFGYHLVKVEEVGQERRARSTRATSCSAPRPPPRDAAAREEAHRGDPRAGRQGRRLRDAGAALLGLQGPGHVPRATSGSCR